MQLFAFNHQGHPISALAAEKQKNYTCLECRGIVRLRGGPHRQVHFYHLDPPLQCKMGGKGMAHLQIQWRLQQLLPPGESVLERRFPEIGRIADVAWMPRRIIFEIQCSPIDYEEVLGRNSAYASLGFQVVWILHDSLFNRWRLSPAERALEKNMHYFTNIDEEGKGVIYDQFDVRRGGRREKKLGPLPIDIRQPKETLSPPSEREYWNLHFAGDFLDLDSSSPYFATALSLKPKSPKSSWLGCFKSAYRLFFHILLERACK